MASKKIQLYTDRDKTIEASPETSANCVILSDGNDLQKVLDNDLTNPTVVHEETSFKVGVGDIDVSSSVVDGEVGCMVIKGKTYQNILPEPSTHVLTNNKEMFKVNEGLDPNVEIVDAVSKSAILSGSTKYQIGEFIQDVYAPVQQFKTGYYLGHSNGTLIQGGNEHKYCEDYIPLPTGVTSITSKGSSNWKKLCCYDSNKNFISGVNGTAGLEDLTLNIPSNAKYFRYSTNTAQGENEYINVVSNTGLLLASSNYNIPCELISCKMPVLTTIGKNLFNLPLVQGSQTYGTIGGKPTHEIYSNRVTNEPNKYIKVKPNTQITFSIINNDVRFAIAELDEHGNRLGDTGWLDTVSQKTITTKSSTHYIGFNFKKVGNTDITVEEVISSNPMFEYSNTSTSYEPHKTNILHTPEEVVLRSLPNSVCDTLNLMTGEYIQRIGEVVLDGTQNWTLKTGNWEFENTFGFVTTISDMINTTQSHPAHSNGNSLVCSHFPSYGGNSLSNNALPNDIEMIGIDLNRLLGLRITKTKLSTPNAEGLKTWLRDNPVTVQYELATPIIKTVDLSSSRNWMELTLTGEEEWRDSGNTPYITPSVQPKKGLIPFSNGEFVGVDRAESFACFWLGGGTNTPNGNLVFYHPMVKNAIQMKEFLRNNPQKIYYYVEDGMGCIRQPIFFKDGHIQLSSGADNSLIPTLDYQAKTSNSYVMDLMKTNTKYTMKAKSASGAFTIDGTSYGAGTNGTFTTPTSMTNKLLVMSNKTNTEVMILEGDVTSKTIPYFKGIKSAFEGEDKIEVLSTGRNLCPPQPEIEGHYVRYQNGTYVQHDSYNVSKPIRVIEGHRYRLINTNKHHAYYDKNMNYVTTPLFSGSDGDFYSIAPKNAVYLRVSMMKGLEAVVNTDGVKGEYREPNSTKIPLLSPLRSLPNGVCDELIINRMKKKATLVQRVGVGVLDGTQSISTNLSNVDSNLYQPFYCGNVFGNMAIVPHNVVTIHCDKLLACSSSTTYRSLTTNAIYQYTDSSARLAGQITKKDLGVKSVRDWFRANPTTVYYLLATPVVTEIDLENFPLVYKDGHIFLNSEIAPVVEIDYNVNQSQQIQANNETLQRHELDILDLDNLIVSFVNAEYNLRLLKFDMELSMMALAE